MKAADVIRRAYRLMRVLDSNSALSAEESRDALDVLNGLFAEWRGSGIPVPDYSVADENTDLTIELADREAVAYQLAFRLSPEFAKSMTAEQAAAMDQSWSRFALRYFQPGVSNFAELPVPTGVGGGYRIELDA